jgi:transcriptional regulator with XRE-family HTH domain
MASTLKQPNDLLRYHRKLRHWTQKDVADELYNLCQENEERERGIINSNMVGAWERGDHPPSLFWQKKLCQLFGKDATELGVIENQGVTKSSNPDGTTLMPSTPVSKSDTLPDHLNYISRRGFLHIAGGAVGTTLFTNLPFRSALHLSHLLRTEELLSIYATNIPICWRLYFDGCFLEADSLLSDCLPSLATLVLQASPYQKWAASLASKAHQLACMFALQAQKFGKALVHAKQAFHYGQVAEDPNVQVASLIRKGLVYFYLERPEQKLATYQEAIQYSSSASPLLRGRVYMGLAEAHSNFGQKQEYQAKHFLELAHKTFPDNPREDPNYVYTFFKLPQEYGGLIYLNLNEPSKAWEAFARVDKAIPTTVSPERVELSIRQARASAALGNLEQTRAYLEAAIISAAELGSDLRYNETHEVYQQVLRQWGQEQQIKELSDLFIR